MSQLDRAANYIIRVEGRVDEALAECFGPVQIKYEMAADGRAITHLVTAAADQAAFVGLIRHLHGLGIVLLSFERTIEENGKGGHK